METRKNIIAKYNFENYVVEKYNQEVVRLLENVANNKNVTSQVILFHGTIGLGKTHLLHALANKVLKNESNMSLELYNCGMRHIVTAIQLLEDVDYLLLNDLHELDLDHASCMYLLEKMKELTKKGTIIIMTSDVPVDEIKKITIKMKEFITSGKVVELTSLDYITARDILVKKIEMEGLDKIPFTEEAINLIAKEAQESVRHLEGLLLKVVIQANLQSKSIIDEIFIRGILEQ